MKAWRPTSSALTELEDIGNSFEGVSQTYAIQAGREIRVLVRPDDVDDMAAIIRAATSPKRSRTICYPGQIRVTVVREDAGGGIRKIGWIRHRIARITHVDNRRAHHVQLVTPGGFCFA
ncbi:MAG: hypothetical protein R2838_08415 [Caldilineaceae bacterium]